VQDVTRLPSHWPKTGWGYHIAMPVRSRPRAPVPAAQNSIFCRRCTCRRRCPRAVLEVLQHAARRDEFAIGGVRTCA